MRKNRYDKKQYRPRYKSEIKAKGFDMGEGMVGDLKATTISLSETNYKGEIWATVEPSHDNYYRMRIYLHIDGKLIENPLPLAVTTTNETKVNDELMRYLERGYLDEFIISNQPSDGVK